MAGVERPAGNSEVSASDESATATAAQVVAPLPPGSLARLVAIVRPSRLDATMEALAALGLHDVLIEAVRGYGRQKQHLDLYEEAGLADGSFLPKVRLQFVVPAEQLERAATAVQQGARTGRIGDGKLFVHRVAAAPAAENEP